jgi:hypothetical protein
MRNSDYDNYVYDSDNFLPSGFSISAGEQVTVSFEVKTDTSMANFYVGIADWGNSGGGWVAPGWDNNSYDVSADGQFHSVSWTLTAETSAPVGPNPLRLQFTIDSVSKNKVTIYVKNVSVTKGGGDEKKDEGYAPSAPTGVTAYALSSSGIEVSWNSVSGATYYDIYYEVGASSTKYYAATVSGSSYTHTGLSSGTTYYYYITASNSYGESNYSSYDYATTSSSSSGGSTPSAPTDVKAGASSEGIYLYWDLVYEEALYYRIYRSTSAYGTYTNIGETEYYYAYYEDYDVLPNTTYYYKVKAVNSAGTESAYSSYTSAYNEWK